MKGKKYYTEKYKTLLSKITELSNTLVTLSINIYLFIYLFILNLNISVEVFTVKNWHFKNREHLQASLISRHVQIWKNSLALGNTYT